MTTNTEALSQLVAALTASTRAGKTNWDPVNVRGSTFLASRPGGTVLISGPLGGGTSMLLNMSNPITIEVKNASGDTIERGEAGGVAAAAIGMPQVPGLKELWDLVAVNRSQSADALKKLAREFDS
jgi:hypothetical protein